MRSRVSEPVPFGCAWPSISFKKDLQSRTRLVGFGDFDRAEAFEWSVDEEDLHRDVGLDVGLAEEREDLAAGELLDRLLVALGHDPLEVLTHGDHTIGLAAVHDRLLE